MALQVQQPEDRTGRTGAERVDRQHQTGRRLVPGLLGERNRDHVDRPEDRAGGHERHHQHL